MNNSVQGKRTSWPLSMRLTEDDMANVATLCNQLEMESPARGPVSTADTIRVALWYAARHYSKSTDANGDRDGKKTQ